MLIIEINRLVKRAFDVAGRESSSRCGDSSEDENMARYAILSQRYSPSLESVTIQSEFQGNDTVALSTVDAFKGLKDIDTLFG